jgi:hypothetical protein
MVAPRLPPSNIQDQVRALEVDGQTREALTQHYYISLLKISTF